MGLSIISFTENGMHLSIKIAGQWNKIYDTGTAVFTKCLHIKESIDNSVTGYVEQSVEEWAGEQMRAGNTMLFIGACGIAVRAIAPFVTDKLYDAPVLVMDEHGKYVIPILSGHMGGANELALQIAEVADATPIITTATDINKRFAVDLFAKKNGLHIVNKDGIAKVSSKALAGKEISISIENGHVDISEKLPEGTRLVSYPPMQPVDVLITSQQVDCDALICLRPKEYVIGMGCKKGKEAEKISDMVHKSIQAADIDMNSVFALASIDCKKQEQGFLTLSRKENILFLTFSAERLQAINGNFHASAFVKAQVGVDNVCERAALAACGANGSLVCEKYAEDGITIAIAKRDWRVSFDEE